MHKKYCLVLLTTFVLLLFNIIPFIAYAQEADNRLFHNLGAASAITPGGEELSTEQTIVYVDFNVLKGEDGYAPVLLLECFDQSIQVEQTRVGERGLTDYAWCGKAKGCSISNVVLTISDNIMFGRIEYLDCVYVVDPVENGPLHRITKVDPTKVVPFGNDALIPSQKLEQEGIMPQRSLPEPPTAAALANGSVIDIMVLYTDGMATAYPGNQIVTKINNFVDLANQAYTNSQINTRA